MRSLSIVLLACALGACGGPGGGDAGNDGGPDGGGPDGSAAGSALTVTGYIQHAFPGGAIAPLPWLAVQHGDAPWRVLTSTDGNYTADISDPSVRYGIAVACGGTANLVQVLQATLIEGAHVAIVCPQGAAGDTRPISMSISPPGPCGVNVTYPNTQWTTICGDAATFQVLAGPHDVVASTNVAAPGDLDRVYVARDVDQASWPVDLNDPTYSRPSAGARLDVPAATPTLIFFYTATTPHLIRQGSGGGQWGGFPADLRHAEDVHMIQAGYYGLSTRTYLREPVDVDFSSLPLVVAPTATVTHTGADWSPYLASGFQVQIGAWSLAFSAGWLDRGTHYEFPRLCDVPTFPGTCADADPATTWMFWAFKPSLGFVARLPDILAATASPLLAPDGLTFSGAVASGSF